MLDFLIISKFPSLFKVWRGGGVPLVGVRTGEEEYNRDLRGWGGERKRINTEGTEEEHRVHGEREPKSPARMAAPQERGAGRCDTI